MKYRLIIISEEDGSNEQVIFLEADSTEPATDWCTPRQTVDFDQVIDADLPAAFPLESALHNIR